MDVLEILKNYYWQNRITATAVNYFRNFNKTDLNGFNGLYINEKSNYFKFSTDPFKFKSKIIDNNFYSIYSILEKLNYDASRVYAEHGLFLGNYFQEKLMWLSS